MYHARKLPRLYISTVEAYIHASLRLGHVHSGISRYFATERMFYMNIDKVKKCNTTQRYLKIIITFCVHKRL